MRATMRTGRWLILAWGLAGCQRTAVPSPPPPAPPPVVVPEGCLANLSGEWVHDEDPAFRYLGVDDGGTLTLEVTQLEGLDAGFRPRKFRDAGVVDAGEAAPADAGPPAAPDAGPSPVRLVLERTPQGFRGATRVWVRHPQGRSCEASFPAEVVECRDGGLVLSATPAVAVGEDCKSPEGTPAPGVRQPLHRR